jgi:hypothetical protein
VAEGRARVAGFRLRIERVAQGRGVGEARFGRETGRDFRMTA